MKVLSGCFEGPPGHLTALPSRASCLPPALGEGKGVAGVDTPAWPG